MSTRADGQRGAEFPDLLVPGLPSLGYSGRIHRGLSDLLRPGVLAESDRGQAHAGTFPWLDVNAFCEKLFMISMYMLVAAMASFKMLVRLKRLLLIQIRHFANSTKYGCQHSSNLMMRNCYRCLSLYPRVSLSNKLTHSVYLPIDI